LIFLPNLLALSASNLGSARQTIGILISVQNLDVQSCIIRSGPMPAGSPGEYIIFFNLDLLFQQKPQLSWSVMYFQVLDQTFYYTKFDMLDLR